MEVPEQEVLGSNKKGQKLILKRKRTKRPRPPPMFPDLPLSRNTNSSSSCSTAAEASGDDRVLTSSTSDQTCEFPQTKVVNDEDLANCLILLAQGHNRLPKSSYPPIITRGPDNSGIGGDVYKCKTCDRRFPSFQALGGHRTSHKKPKGIIEEKICSENLQINDLGRVPIPNCRDSGSSGNKFKVHECSICGAEFNSGQALGGHMRRHRPINHVRPMPGGEDSQLMKKSRSNDLLELDLNLPAPEVDELASDYTFESKEEGHVFSASSLVDCHY